MKYPGDVNVPMPLVVQPEVIAQIGKYGDVVVFPKVDGKMQAQESRENHVPYAIHPKQKYVLTRPA